MTSRSLFRGLLRPNSGVKSNVRDACKFQGSFMCVGWRERYACILYKLPPLPFKARLDLIYFCHGFRDFQTKGLTRQVRDCRHPDGGARSALSSTWRSVTHLLRQQEMYAPDLHRPWLDPTVGIALQVSVFRPNKENLPFEPGPSEEP